MPQIRGLLLAAVNRPNLIEAAQRSAAEVVVLDMETVAADEKGAARSGLRDAIAGLKAAGKTAYVRLSRLESKETRADLAAAIGPGLDGVVLPGAQAATQIREIDVLLREQELHSEVRPGTVVLVPEIGGARGVLRIEDVVLASTRISGIALDGGTYAANLGVEWSAAALAYARGVIANCCSAYGLTAIDAAFPNADEAGLRADVASARAMGFAAKYVLAPEQVEALA